MFIVLNKRINASNNITTTANTNNPASSTQNNTDNTSTTTTANSNLDTSASTTLNVNATGLEDDDWHGDIEDAKVKIRNLIKRKSEEIDTLQKRLRVLEQL